MEKKINLNMTVKMTALCDSYLSENAFYIIATTRHKMFDSAQQHMTLYSIRER